MTYLEEIVFSLEIQLKDEFNISECVICLDEFKTGDKIVRVPLCKHFFHPDCMKKWLNRSIKDSDAYHKCPLCNTELRLQDLEKAKELKDL